MDEKLLPVTITLTVANWQQIIVALSARSFNGNEKSEELCNEIATIVANKVGDLRKIKGV